MLRDLDDYLHSSNVVVSPIRLGDWLLASMGTEIVLERRKRQRAAEALAMGPPVKLTPLPFQPAELPKTPPAPPVTNGAPLPPPSAPSVPRLTTVAPPSSMTTAVELPAREDEPASSLPPLAWVSIGFVLVAIATYFMTHR
jgi:hypothetical protein